MYDRFQRLCTFRRLKKITSGLISFHSFLETCTQIFDAHAVYFYLVIHQADVRALATLVGYVGPYKMAR